MGAAHAVGVASGTDALWLALKASGVGPGRRVLTTPFTFFATASAIVNAGAEPVFADVDPQTCNLDPDRVRAVLERASEPHRRLRIDPETIVSILPVHLFGQSVDGEALTKLASDRDLTVVEDAAQALGGKYQGGKVGCLGDAACFSFFPTKNLGGFGDGGMVVTDRGDLAERVRVLRAHGASRGRHHEVVGTNSRLDALQAALLAVKLTHVDGWISARRAVAAGYQCGLDGIDGLGLPQPAPDRSHTYHQYTVRVGDGRRDALSALLRAGGIETTVYYPVPLHLQRALRGLGYEAGDFPEAEQASREVLSLPMFPELRPEEVEEVVSTVREFFGLG